MANVIDYIKPVRTRSGKKVRILATDIKGLALDDSVIGIVEGDERPHIWQTNGNYFASGLPSSIDLLQDEDVQDLKWADGGFVLTVPAEDGIIIRKTVEVQRCENGEEHNPPWLSVTEHLHASPECVFSGNFSEESLVLLARSILLLFEAATPKDKVVSDGGVEKPTTAWRPLSELPLSNGLHHVLLRGIGFCCSGNVFCHGGKVTRVLFDGVGGMASPDCSSHYYPTAWMELPL